jgi:hypothetical protein
MIPVMQVGLFFQQAQTIRNLLAAELGVPENSNLTDADRQATPLTASARKFISSTMSTTLNLVSEMERIANALGTEEGGAMKISLSTVAEKIAGISASKRTRSRFWRFPRAGATCTSWSPKH